jgi:hypothetical protein
LLPTLKRTQKYGIALALVLGAIFGGARFLPWAEQNPNPRQPATEPVNTPLVELHAIEPSVCKDFYKQVCQIKSGPLGDGRDPTGLVHSDVEGERIAESFLKDIIEKHPDWSSDQVDDELVKVIYTPERRARIEAAYHWVEYRIERFIDSQPEHVFTLREKKEIKSRLRKTELQLPTTAAVYSDEPDLFTKNDVYYERTPDGQMRMRVGGAYLFTAKSWFNIVFTLGHELGHSIDPCEIRQARLSYPAYDRLTACFLRTGLVKTTKLRTECAENDQLSETFADWIAAKVSAEALKNFSVEFHGPQLVNAAENSVRDLCEQEEGADVEVDEDDHPSPRVRIDGIYGSNPEIRNLLGCEKPSADYCSFESVLPLPIYGPTLGKNPI